MAWSAAMAERPGMPTPLARRWVRYLLGFGVAVGLALAVFLGAATIPGFRALLTLFGEDLKVPLIPLSAFLMGTVAVAVEFYAGERIPRRTLRRLFRNLLVALLAALLLLIVLFNFFVVQVGPDDIPFLVSWERQPHCACPPEVSPAECIRRISLDREAVEHCWGRGVRLIRLSLMLVYLIAISAFGALVGVLLIREQAKERRGSKKRRRPSPPES